MDNICEALGVMTIAYALSEVSFYCARRLEQVGRASFCVTFLILTHYLSSMASMFVGLFMFYQKERLSDLQRTIDELTKQKNDSAATIDDLKSENEHLKYQLGQERIRFMR